MNSGESFDRSRDVDAWQMRRALELAALGRGVVEPNPLVGCVIARGAEIIGEGFHARYGGDHAEVAALAIAGERARGATMYVTLEPCCHTGKTPPCTEAIIAAGIQRVVVAQQDPFPQVAGSGLAALHAAGIDVDLGLLEADARRLNAAYLKLQSTKRPWIIAKWAMSLDGKIATANGDSRWISNAVSRAIVHRLRGRVDAIVVGRGTAVADDPLLIARPAGPRVATRIVLDARATLSSESQLARTARDVPVIVAVGSEAASKDPARLRGKGCEVFVCSGGTHAERFESLMEDIGRRNMTNVLVEGGSRVLGTLFDAGSVDEVHVFISPIIIGGETATSAIGGNGVANLVTACKLEQPRIETLDGDVYVHGTVSRAS